MAVLLDFHLFHQNHIDLIIQMVWLLKAMLPPVGFLHHKIIALVELMNMVLMFTGEELMKFSEETFRKQYNCMTYPLFTTKIHSLGYNLGSLLDHGFIADRACTWDEPDMKDHEFVVVARTYREDMLETPIPGLRVVKLPDEYEEPGTAIVIAIVGPSKEAEAVLSTCCLLPACHITYCLSQSMANSGYRAVAGLDDVMTIKKLEGE